MKQIVAWKQVREPMGLRDTTREWNRRSGQNLTHQRVDQIIRHAIHKIRVQLEADPTLLRDLSAEADLEPSEAMALMFGEDR